MSSSDIDLSGLDEDSSDESETTDELSLIEQLLKLSDGPDLIEIFGGSGSGKTVFSVEVARSAINDSDMDVLFIDTEKNIGDEGIVDNIDYVYIPDWRDVYAFVTGKTNKLSSNPFGDKNINNKELPPGYDLVILDSIGFPALVQYADYRIEDNADQFQIFLEIEHMVGALKKYSQIHNSLVLVTNQPKSDLSNETEPAPFGDKAIYGFKEILKTYKDSSQTTSTRCTVKAFRSRQFGKGKDLFRITITDDGVDIQNVIDNEADDWMPE